MREEGDAMKGKRMSALSIETVYIAFRYVTYLVLLIAFLFWMKKGMYFGFVLAFLLAITAIYFYFQFRNTEIYHLYHSTNKVLYEKLLAVFQQKKKDILTCEKVEKGFFILEDNEGIRFGYYLPYGRKGSKRLYRIKSYVEELESLTDKHNVDCPILIMDNKAEFNVRLLKKIHPEYNFEFRDRQFICRYMIL